MRWSLLVLFLALSFVALPVALAEDEPAPPKPAEPAEEKPALEAVELPFGLDDIAPAGKRPEGWAQASGEIKVQTEPHKLARQLMITMAGGAAMVKGLLAPEDIYETIQDLIDSWV